MGRADNVKMNEDEIGKRPEISWLHEKIID